MKSIVRNTVIGLSAVFMILGSGCSDEEDIVQGVESIALSADSLTLEKGGTARLECGIFPEDAVPSGEMSWISDNVDAATVSNGEVTAVSEGVARIIVSLDGLSDTCVVTVTTVHAEKVVLNEEVLELTVGEQFQLEAEVTPPDAEYRLAWESSDASVASVSNSGLVVALAEGESVVTVRAGDRSASCTVRVSPVEVESVVLSETDLRLKVGESAVLTASVRPDNAGDKTVTWCSDDESVATVDDGTVMACGVGNTVVRAEAGGMTAECSVTVEAVEVERINLSLTSCVLSPGDTCSLTVEILPDNATDKTVEWSVDEPSVAQVENGLITALSEGVAVVTARAGSVASECSVRVEEKGVIKSDWTVGEVFEVRGYAKGVVFEASVDYIKVVSIDHAVLQWAVNPLISTGYTDLETVDGTDGNAALADASASSPGNFPAYEWCADKGDGWGLPSYKECESLYGDVRATVEGAVIAEGGQAFPEEVWTCIEDPGFFGIDYAYVYGVYSLRQKNAATGTLAVLMIEL